MYLVLYGFSEDAGAEILYLILTQVNRSITQNRKLIPLKSLTGA
jgi:hypothetical protein